MPSTVPPAENIAGFNAKARAARIFLALVLALAVLCAVTSLWQPLGWDHGMMASVGAVIAEGGAPYLDAWEMKGPLAYIPFALSAALFGNTMWGVRVVDLAILIPALYCFHRTIGALTSFAIGAGAGLALYFWIASQGFFFTAQPEDWVMALATMAMCLLLRPNAVAAVRPWVFLLMGALSGCTGLIKTHFLGFGLAPLVFLAIASDLNVRRRLVLAGWLAAGALAPIAAVLAWLAAHGAIGAFVEAYLIFNLTSYGGAQSLDLRGLALGVLGFFTQGPAPIMLPFAAAGIWARRREPIIIAPLLAWLGVAFFVVLVQGKLFVYHWFPLYAPLLFCAALGAHALGRSAQGAAPARILAGAAALLLLAQVVIEPARDVLHWSKMARGGNMQAYYSEYVFNEVYSAGDMVAAARYVRSRTGVNDSLFVWGNDAIIRFLANRPDATRFTHVLPLKAPGPLRAGSRAELMRDLAAAPPAYILIGTPWPAGDKRNALAIYPTFTAFLTERYVLEATIGKVNLYRRIDHRHPRRARRSARR